MRPPKKARMVKAIQWSMSSIRWLNKLAQAQPIKGIKAWKNPKKKAITNIGRHHTRFNKMPLAMDTAKQSMASPMAISQISNPLIISYF